MLFDLPPESPPGADGTGITGVVDWAAASCGPDGPRRRALLHPPRAAAGPGWGPPFTEAYREAGGKLATAANDRLYRQVRAPLAFSEEVQWVAQPWREAGRTDLTTQVVEERLNAYPTSLMHSPS